MMNTQIQSKVLVFLIAAIFFYFGGWFIASQWIKTEIETFLTDTLAKNGQIKIHYEALERGGFPFSLDWHLVNPKVEVNVLSHTLSLNTNKTTLSLYPFFKKSVTVKNQTTEWRLSNNRNNRTFKNITEDSRLYLSKNHEGTIAAEYSASELNIHELVSTNKRQHWNNIASGKHFSALLQFPNAKKRRLKTRQHSISFKINNVSIVNKNIIWLNKLDQILGLINLRGDPGTFTIEDLTTWRDNGGTIDAEKVQFDSAPYKLIFKGTLALDAGLKPIGAGTIDFSGLASFLKDQQKAGRITKSEADFLRLAIRVLSKSNNQHAQSMTRIPITAQEGKLKVGLFSLFDLPSLIR